MATETDAGSDVGIGLVGLFGLLAVGGALLTFLAPTQAASAVGFSVAVALGCALVAVLHLYD